MKTFFIYINSWKGKYVLGLGLLSIILIGSQFVLRQYIEEQKFDITILQTATNQRLLSQALSKKVLVIAQGNDTEQHLLELKKNIKIFEEAHLNLTQKSNSLGFNGGYKNSDILRGLYNDLQPYYTNLVDALQKIYHYPNLKDSISQQAVIDKILRNEAQFEQIMDKIVDRYYFENNTKSSKLRWVEWGVLILSLFILILAGFFIFRPIIEKADNVLAELNESYNEVSVAEEETRQSLEELKSIQEALEVAYFEMEAMNNALERGTIVSVGDLQGNILKVNEAFCETSQYTEQELLGKNHNVVNSGYHSHEFWVKMWRTISSGQTWEGEVKNKAKDGTFYWVNAVVTPVYNNKGKIYKYFSIRTLITERKIAEEKLLAAKEELQKQHEELSLSHQDITSSISYASRIQQAILPPQQDLINAFSEHFVFYKPRDIVAGDFYWYAEVQGIHFLAMVDCTGHGVPGAFMTLIAHDLLNEIVKVHNIIRPDLILNELRLRIIEELRQKESDNQDGMEISVCAINTTNGNNVIQYASNATELVYFQQGTMHTIKSDLIIIGGFRNYLPNKYFTLHTIPIISPTTIYMFSDGYQDQFGGDFGKKFGVKRLKKMLNDINTENMEIQKTIISQNFEQWYSVSNEKQIDDILVMGIKISN